MRSRSWWIASAAWALGCVGQGADGNDRPPGKIMDESGSPVVGALVTVRGAGDGMAWTVYSAADGSVELPSAVVPGLIVEVRGPAAEADARAQTVLGPDGRLGELQLEPAEGPGEPRGSSFLAQIPESERKRRAVVDCGGCHIFDSARMRPDGHPRTSEEWAAAIRLMLETSGQGTGFPIISGAWDVEADAEWLAAAIAGAEWPTDPVFDPESVERAGGAVLTEYDMPEPMDLAHDVAVDAEGRVLVTGMFTHRMYVLDPESGMFETVDIPVPNANPRAVDVDGEGRWWVLLGAPQTIAVYDPAAGEWDSWPIGAYPHSIGLDSGGGVWFNGHFSLRPEVIGRLDPATGRIERWEVDYPGSETAVESTIPYGLRVAEDDVVWATQLRGNRLIRLDPEVGEAEVWEMPTTHSGPRRPDVAPDGRIWIPEFGADKLAVFDPSDGTFTEYDFPVEGAAPYVVRVDGVRGMVWIGAGQGDVVASFDPNTERFTLYPLPTRGALIRHLDIDERTGEVWATYSASPGIGGKVLRIEP